jgi:nucleoside-diphosphate-sugar epimerase
MLRDLVTGGTGLVGSFIICELLNSGRSVRATARSNSDKSWFNHLAQNLVDESSLSQLEWVEGDVTDPISMLDCVEGCSRVFHAAALVSFNNQDKTNLMNANVNGTANIVNACLVQEERPILCFVSSTATMGKVSAGPIDENSNFIFSEAGSSYAQSKYLGELEAIRGREEGLNVAIINPSIILGFGNWHTGSCKFFKNAKGGFPFYTSGTNGFVDVRDVARASIQLLEGSHFGGRFLCTGENVPYYDIFTRMAESFKSKPPRIKVSIGMARIAWRLSRIKRFFGGKSILTKSSALAGMRKIEYNSDRLRKKLDFNFTSFGEGVPYHVELYTSFTNKRA